MSQRLACGGENSTCLMAKVVEETHRAEAHRWDAEVFHCVPAWGLPRSSSSSTLSLIYLSSELLFLPPVNFLGICLPPQISVWSLGSTVTFQGSVPSFFSFPAKHLRTQLESSAKQTKPKQTRNRHLF